MHNRWSFGWRAIIAIAAAWMCGTVGGGCTPAQVSWSPDGKRAAYFSGTGSALLFTIDAEGRIVDQLGSSGGGAAWSADSQTLYAAVQSRAVAVPAKVDMSWADEWAAAAVDAAIQADVQLQAAGSAEAQELSTLTRVRSDEPQAMAALPPCLIVVHLTLSPDEQWLAALAMAKVWGANDERNNAAAVMLVYHIPSGHLRLLGRSGHGACFTGPNRLTYVAELPGYSAIRELVLDDAAPKVEPTVIAMVPPGARWLQTMGDALLFSAPTAEIPLVRPDQRIAEFRTNLYRCDAKAASLNMIAADVGDYFALSPDGSRILIEKPDRGGGDGWSHLAVVDADGSDLRVLGKLAPAGGMAAMFPAWRGNDQITFTESPDSPDVGKPDKDGRVVLNVMQYQLGADGALRPLGTLSKNWKQEQKPSVKLPDAAPAQR